MKISAALLVVALAVTPAVAYKLQRRLGSGDVDENDERKNSVDASTDSASWNLLLLCRNLRLLHLLYSKLLLLKLKHLTVGKVYM